MHSTNMKQKKFSLFPYLWKYKWYYLAGIVILLAVDAANLYIPQFIGEVIDGLTEGILDREGVLFLLVKIFMAGDSASSVPPGELNIVCATICSGIWRCFPPAISMLIRRGI